MSALHGSAQPTRPGTLLRHAADVTADWLTEALADAGVLAHGSRVVSFETEAIGTGQMADTTRFSLAYKTKARGPASVVGKFAVGRRPEPRDRTRAARLRDRGPLLPRGRRPGHGAGPGSPTWRRSNPRRAGSRSCSRTSSGAARVTRSRRVGPSRGRRPRRDGGPARALLGGGGAGRTRMAAPHHTRVRRLAHRAR